MKKILVLTAFLASISLFVMVAVPSVSAYSCGTHLSTVNGVETMVSTQTSIDFTNGDPNNKLCSSTGASPVTALLLWVIGFLSIGVGVAVVIGIIFGGIMYAMSDGDASKAKQGKDIITNAIIGLFLFLFLYTVANFLVPGGIFT